MKFYLKVLNPIIALIVFLLCFWAATASEEKFSIFGIVIGGMSTYFFAKGIFTGCSLLILGRILLEIFKHSEKNVDKKYSKTEIIYSVSFGVFTIGSLIGLFLLHGFESSHKKVTSVSYEVVENPATLKIENVHRVKESDRLKYSGRISNESDHKWAAIEITGNLIIDGKLSDEAEVTIDSIKSMQGDQFVIDYNDFCNKNVPESSYVDFQVTARKE